MAAESKPLPCSEHVKGFTTNTWVGDTAQASNLVCCFTAPCACTVTAVPSAMYTCCVPRLCAACPHTLANCDTVLHYKDPAVCPQPLATANCIALLEARTASQPPTCLIPSALPLQCFHCLLAVDHLAQKPCRLPKLAITQLCRCLLCMQGIRATTTYLSPQCHSLPLQCLHGPCRLPTLAITRL
jgi:hypothetical protein